MSEENKYSKDEFFNFVDYVGRKGLVKSSTTNNWRSSANALFSLLDDNKIQDLRNVNVDDICAQYANLRKASPQSLQVYKSRLKGALDDFFKYVEDPINYKPQISPRTSKRTVQTQNNYVKKIENEDSKSNNSNFGENSSSFSQSGLIVFPIPIRQNLVVQIRCLPHDLTDEEAEKICAVIKALAIQKKV